MRLTAFTALTLVCFVSTPCTIVSAQTASDGSTGTDVADGHDLYVASCSSCHQAAGQGMANMAPALKDNPILAGDSTQLIQIVLKGPAAVLPANRPKFGSSTMDSFYYKLSDDQVAAILNYVRREFGKDVKTPDIQVRDVAAVRAKVDPNTLN